MGSASVGSIPDMAQVKKIQGPVAQRRPPPPQPLPAAQSDSYQKASKVKPESVDTNRVDTERPVETHGVHNDEANATTTALFRVLPDWMQYCAAVPLLPNGASEKYDYENLQSLSVNQARYVDRLITLKNRWSKRRN